MAINSLRLGRKLFSETFWTTVLSRQAFLLPDFEKLQRDHYSSIEDYREEADFNTGSIPLATSILLSAATAYFNPSTVAEVGTFIGRSTLAMAKAKHKVSSTRLKIHTCDYSNSISLVGFEKCCELNQYQKQSSTQMFKDLLDKRVVVDAFMVDGRLSDMDVSLMSELRGEQFVIFLDDFEGVEKGVMNSLSISKFFGAELQLFYPPSQALLEQFGLLGTSTLAVMLPESMITMVPQG